ncbi:hypothetical protein KIL84_009206 [Mauremys mutica]|uniref:Uncharacterized protein n=1 Tax=Mauremys mutica TaxID=74926 RepID=A0A9D3XJQ5_9SAUR|nr:hypothetical protein KIL84_009206 [Mauremys mutica]
MRGAVDEFTLYGDILTGKPKDCREQISMLLTHQTFTLRITADRSHIHKGGRADLVYHGECSLQSSAGGVEVWAEFLQQSSAGQQETPIPALLPTVTSTDVMTDVIMLAMFSVPVLMRLSALLDALLLWAKIFLAETMLSAHPRCLLPFHVLFGSCSSKTSIYYSSHIPLSPSSILRRLEAAEFSCVLWMPSECGVSSCTFGLRPADATSLRTVCNDVLHENLKKRAGNLPRAYASETLRPI